MPASTPPVGAADPAPTPLSVELDAERRVPQGGFSFQPLREYTVVSAGASVTLQAPDVHPALGPTFMLSGGPRGQFTDAAVTSLPDAFAQFIQQFAPDAQIQVIDQRAVTVNDAPGLAAEITNRGAAPDGPFMGRIVMVQPATERIFVMVGIAPAARWNDAVSTQFDAVLQSVTFSMAGADTETFSSADAASTPVATSPASGTGTATPAVSAPAVPPPTWNLLSNANFVHDVAMIDRIIWAATSGGIVAWNTESGASSKFTALDGLTHNVARTVAVCAIADLGVVFGTPQGLQIFDWESGGWRSLQSRNSPMSFDNVRAVACDAASNLLVIGYAQQGLDIFDAVADTWTHINRSDGLASNVVNALALDRARRAIWVASDGAISVVRDETISVYDASNSPLGNADVAAIAVAPDGTAWLGAGHTLYRTAATADGAPVWSVFRADTVADARFPAGDIAGLAIAPDGTVWFGSVSGQICRFDAQSERCTEWFDTAAEETSGLARGPLTRIRVGGDESVYYTTWGNGFARRNAGAWEPFVLPDEPLLGNRIRAMVQDAEGTVWVASDGGVQRFETAERPAGAGRGVITVTPLGAFDSSPVGADVRVVAPDPRGGLWFGAESAAYYDGAAWTTYTTLNGLVGAPVHAIEIDSRGRAWIGTGRGLSIVANEAFINLTRADGLPNDDIRALLADDPAGVVWAGSNGGGLLRFAQNQVQVFTESNAGLPSNTITALARDADGSLLVGSERGLARFVQGDVTPIRAVSNVAVTDIATGDGGIVWVGTANSGAFYFNGLAWEQFTSTDNLPAQHISAVLVTADGTAWLGGENGGITLFRSDFP